MAFSDREFKEAIESFKVVDSCLKCYYEGESHMYRPLSAQLRILLCDSNRKKDNSLLTRLFKNIEITPIETIEYQKQGTFNEGKEILNNIEARSSDPDVEIRIAPMPFEIIQFENGLEIANLMVAKGNDPISMESWLEQYISIYPVPITIRKLIKTVADRGGGAHVHTKVDSLLSYLSTSSPTTIGVDALFMIAIARFIQELGWHIVQFYEKNGTTGSLTDISKKFDKKHECVVNSSQVPKELYKRPHNKMSLMSLGNNEGNSG